MENNIIFRPNEELPDIIELMRSATVDKTSVEQAIANWKDKPPDPNFKEILVSKI